MATVPEEQTSRMMWHVRGTWSPREDRVPSAVWLGVLWVGMIAGFGADIPAFARRNPPAPTVLWVHGAVFTVFMLLLTAQVLLVLSDRVAWHRKVGWFAGGWACLMGVMGPWAAIASTLYSVKLHGPSPLSVYLRAGRRAWWLSSSAGVGDCTQEESGGAQENDDPFDRGACRSRIFAPFRPLHPDGASCRASMVRLHVLR